MCVNKFTGIKYSLARLTRLSEGRLLPIPGGLRGGGQGRGAGLPAPAILLLHLHPTPGEM